MGRWTQYDEDDYRLPEGVKRIGYDADTGEYTFSDERGTVYTSAPYERYGYLTPVKRSPPEDNFCLLPRNFAVPTSGPSSPTSPTSFRDILPESLIASQPTQKPASSLSPRARFIEIVWRASMPRLYNVVINAMRAAKATKKPPLETAVEEDVREDVKEDVKEDAKEDAKSACSGTPLHLSASRTRLSGLAVHSEIFLVMFEQSFFLVTAKHVLFLLNLL